MTMSTKIIVHKNRTNIVRVRLGIDISGDDFTSEIRSDTNHTSLLIATWSVAFTTDGVDGELTLTLDDAATADISVDSGFMDLKRVSGGEPFAVFDKPLGVSFQGTVTA